MKSLQWLKSINIRPHLTGDCEMLYQECGLDTLIHLWEKLPSMNLYISTKPLNDCKRVYIMQEYDGKNVKALASKLNVSERFVLKVLSQAERISKPQHITKSTKGQYGKRH